MRIHNPTITGSLALSGSSLTIDTTGTLSGSATSTGSFGSVVIPATGKLFFDGGSKLKYT